MSFKGFEMFHTSALTCRESPTSQHTNAITSISRSEGDLKGQQINSYLAGQDLERLLCCFCLRWQNNMFGFIPCLGQMLRSTVCYSALGSKMSYTYTKYAFHDTLLCLKNHCLLPILELHQCLWRCGANGSLQRWVVYLVVFLNGLLDMGLIWLTWRQPT